MTKREELNALREQAAKRCAEHGQDMGIMGEMAEAYVRTLTRAQLKAIVGEEAAA